MIFSIILCVILAICYLIGALTVRSMPGEFDGLTNKWLLIVICPIIGIWFIITTIKQLFKSKSGGKPMFQLYDGRTYFWQWDASQKLVTTTLPVGSEVHFYHDKDEKLAFKSVVEQEGSKRICKVPDELLKHEGNIKVYGYIVDNPNARTGVSAGNRTAGRKIFRVKPREQPVT